MVSVEFKSGDLDALIKGMEELAKGPTFRDIGRFEATFATCAEAVNAKVHVLTGALKASQIESTNFTGSEWTGTIELAKHPGIFELARGDQPSLNHPEGGHDFFAAAEPFVEKFGEDLNSWVRDHLGTKPGAPGLG